MMIIGRIVFRGARCRVKLHTDNIRYVDILTVGFLEAFVQGFLSYLFLPLFFENALHSVISYKRFVQ